MSNFKIGKDYYNNRVFHLHKNSSFVTNYPRLGRSESEIQHVPSELPDINRRPNEDPYGTQQESDDTRLPNF